ncbi:siderophore ABC transporter substrate-binding protein [Sphingobacterium yanglingense]|uniref:Iron complex transport system substrate-binding protein n=1 Tax=Sphingobacterium yanglingense TaxID=1437280 RepID=A0A4R6WEI9_9SPHI|nr:siderophore ABC transporter substrate-binding protein [Sphingobacterium yanglingense]TDQ78212.1 iron complex transport system substrate-binding protein [Sphingobacterium yanglingense]
MKKSIRMRVGNLCKITMCGLLFLGMIACQSNSSNEKVEGVSDNLITVHHKYGDIAIAVKPERVVVLDIGALETMKELGLVPTGVPKKFLPDYLSDYRDNPSITDVGSVIEPNFEAISALKPNLIFISTRQERFYDELSEIAPTVFVGTDNKNYLSSFEANVQMIASIFSKSELATIKLDSLKHRIETAQEKFKDDPNKALFLIYNNGKFSAFGKGSRFGFIHDVLGIKPVLDLEDESVHGQRVSNELIAEANPDYLFIVDRNAAVLGKTATREEVENKLIKMTNAYKNRKMFYLDPNVWFISGGGLTSINLMVDDIVQLIQ